MEDPDPALDHTGTVVPLSQVERDRLLLDMYGRVVKVEAIVTVLPDHEERLRTIEKRQWGLPASLLIALLSMFGIHHS